MSSAAKQEHTPDSLPHAVAELLRLNNYAVQTDVHINGAQIDLVARSDTDPFAPPLYIEVTTEYVNTDKYGRDATKFLLVQHKEPSCSCLCVSTLGFTPEVTERASASNIRTLTYDQLFRTFEKFTPYVDLVLGDPERAAFNELYEEPYLSDECGDHLATTWLSTWRTANDPRDRWLIVLGEYGTGKTSLTRILQYRWLKEYRHTPVTPIPFRIELRDFSRQFDARTLIHHFLDRNGLGALPIDFVFHLMRNGRIFLLLDGYDEMAQFMNQRERRSCLAALADLASEGAHGLLTSRPNFFTIAEELRVFESLYASLSVRRLGRVEREHIKAEQQLDSLVEQYWLNRHDRHLRDLTPAQTEALVRRKLSNDPKGQAVVLNLLRRVFREHPGGRRLSLSGKPVVITYLLELLDELGQHPEVLAGDLTEWEIYGTIVDRLMARDCLRSPLAPGQRRRFLQRLAVLLSGPETNVARQGDFQKLIAEQFRNELVFIAPMEQNRRREELFEDLRTSATLTRSEGGGEGGWRFSHNSLREYLVAEMMVSSLKERTPVPMGAPISSAMRLFVASLSTKDLEMCCEGLMACRQERLALGTYLTLLWDALPRLGRGLQPLADLSDSRHESALPLSGIRLSRVSFDALAGTAGAAKINGCKSEFVEVTFSGLDLSGSDFSGAAFDAALFNGCDLTDCRFARTWINECDLTNCRVVGADFSGLDNDSVILIEREQKVHRLTGDVARGYLAYRGATTDPVDPFHFWENYDRFPIVMKICEYVAGQRNCQLRGLTQRGEANMDPPFARDFVDHLRRRGLLDVDRNDLVSATAEGRRVLAAFVDHRKMPDEVLEFLLARHPRA